MRKPIASPCAPQPKQWKKPLSSTTLKDGVFSLWNGQSPPYSRALARQPHAPADEVGERKRPRNSSRKPGRKGHPSRHRTRNQASCAGKRLRLSYEIQPSNCFTTAPARAMSMTPAWRSLSSPSPCPYLYAGGAGLGDRRLSRRVDLGIVHLLRQEALDDGDLLCSPVAASSGRLPCWYRVIDLRRCLTILAACAGFRYRDPSRLPAVRAAMSRSLSAATSAARSTGCAGHGPASPL